MHKCSSRLEHVTETLRKALNDLTTLNAQWLQGVAKPTGMNAMAKIV